MKLLDFSGAPNPRRVRIFLAEKGIDIQPEQESLARWHASVSDRPIAPA